VKALSENTRPLRRGRLFRQARLRLRQLSVFVRQRILAGILVAAPFVVTAWLVWRVVSFVDRLVTPLIPVAWRTGTYLPFDVPGLGLLAALLLLLLLGFIATSVAGRSLSTLSGQLLSRLPVVSWIYGWTKQVLESAFGHGAAAFRQVVLLEFPRRGAWSIGFVIRRTEGEVQSHIPEPCLNVFVPATPNPTTGFLVFVPERDLEPLDLTIEEGVKLVLSGGLAATAPTASEPSAARSGLAARISHRLRTYFLAGFLLAAPIGISLWVVWEMVAFVDARVARLVPWLESPVPLPGIGLLIVLLLLLLTGVLARGLVGRTVIRAGERLLASTPFIRGVFAAAKQIFETLLSRRFTTFRRVLLIEYPRPRSWAIAFLTGRARYTSRDGQELLNVFVPTTPNPTSGFLLLIPLTQVIVLAMTAEDAIKLVTSGGLVSPPASKPAVPSATSSASPSASPPLGVGL
jgi:uncharacterized membrane protein